MCLDVYTKRRNCINLIKHIAHSLLNRSLASKQIATMYYHENTCSISLDIACFYVDSVDVHIPKAYSDLSLHIRLIGSGASSKLCLDIARRNK